MLSLAWVSLAWATPSSAQTACSAPDTPISTDRPTAPDSSGTIPEGSLQFETGAGVSRGQGTTTTDLPEMRVRLGLADCTEIRIDLPDYTRAGGRNSYAGASDIAPALKHQFVGLPDGLTLFATLGVALPTGDTVISGRGPAPFLGLPWSYELGDGLTINGMETVLFHPREVNTEAVDQSSLYLDRAVTNNADIFVEYINSYQHGAPTQNSVDLGGSYRYAALRQIDFKIGAGLSRTAPDWYFTIGYSFRFDGPGSK